MKKSHKVIILAFLSLFLLSCEKSPISENKKITPEEKKETVSTEITAKPKEEASTTERYIYNLPLKIESQGECGLGNQVKFEIDEDGTFKYFDEQTKEMITKTLEANKIKELKNLLTDLDIGNLATGSQKAPKGDIQTSECRTVENYTFDVNGLATLFDRNNRGFIHTESYLNALSKIKDKLSSFISKNIGDVLFGNEFQLKIGQSTQVKSENLEIKLESIVEESRCPTDLNCPRKGRVTFSIALSKDGKLLERADISSKYGENISEPLKIDKYSLEMIKITPEDYITHKVPKPPDYVVTFKILN